MAERGGYRSAESYRARTPEAKERQLAGLKKGWGKKGAKKKLQDGGHDLDRPEYKDNICLFAEREFHIPETGQAIKLFDWEKRDILQPLFHDGRDYTLAIVSMAKKNGKSTLAALVAAWRLFCGEDMGEIYIAARDKDQGTWIIFDKLLKAIRMNREMFNRSRITVDSVENKRTGTVLRCLPCDVSCSGLNPSLVIFDELWSYEYEGMRRFYDEMTTVPTRQKPLTLIVTYAGYDQESLLYELYEKGQAGDDPFMFFYWSHENKAPWVTAEYLETQRKRLRPSTYARLHENRWTSGEEAFCTQEQYQACVSGSLLRGDVSRADEGVYVGVDIGLKHDCSAIAAVSVHGEDICLVAHELFVPKGKAPLELEETVEAAILALSSRCSIRQVFYDPYQFQRSAQALRAKGVPCQEYAQTVGNTVKMSETLSTLIQNKRLRLYPSREVRAHLLNAKAKETERGWRLVKRKASKKIDLAVAVALACQAVVESGMRGRPGIVMQDDSGEPERPGESEAERHERMMEDPRCWRDIGSTGLW
jgi:phage terminase large subunit-like protein